MSSAKATPPGPVRILIDMLSILIALGICVWAARSAMQAAPASGAGFAAPKIMAPCLLDKAGYLNGRLYGTIDLEIDWRGPDMDCDGMTRPNNAGMRLFFAASDAGTDKRLIFVVGIDGTVDKISGEEGKANITIIDERTGDFFSTGGNERCWTTVRSVEPIPGQSGKAYKLTGDLYCAGALPSLTGNGSVTLGDFRYSGRLAIDDE